MPDDSGTGKMVVGGSGLSRPIDAVTFHPADLLVKPYPVRFFLGIGSGLAIPRNLVVRSPAGTRHYKTIGR